MEDTDALLARLTSAYETSPALNAKQVPGSALDPKDERYLTELVGGITKGFQAVVLVKEPSSGRIKYLLSQASGAESISLIGQVLDTLGRRIQDDDTTLT